MDLHLFHGWGLAPEESMAPLAHELRARGRLPEASARFADFGFWKGTPSNAEVFAPRSEARRVAVCHSLGFLWLMRNASRDFDAVVSIGGFTRFAQSPDFRCGVPPRVLRRMREKLFQEPGTVLSEFRRNSGFATPLPAEPEVARLAEGLAWLEEWDARDAFASLQCPVLVLAARDDGIVNTAMVENCFSRVTWTPSGGHALPLTGAVWCADVIAAFVRDVFRGK